MPDRYTRNGRPRADRAAQFMPFAALTGYYRMVREQERIVEPRHDPTEEEAEQLSHALLSLRKGDLARVTYYDWDAYITRTGIVESIDPSFRRIRLGGITVPFDDIRAIERTSRA